MLIPQTPDRWSTTGAPTTSGPQGNIAPDVAAWEFSDGVHDFAELADDEGGDESVGNDTGGGAEGARPDAPAAGSDGNDSDSDDEKMNASVLREIELARQARDQQQQQEQAPQNDPPPENGYVPDRVFGGPAPAPGHELPCGSTGTNPATIHRPSDAGGHSSFKHPPIGSIIPPRDAPARDEATEATPAEATPEDVSPADAARRGHAANAAARGDGDASSSGTARRINFENIKSPIECFKEFFTDDIVQRICNCTNGSGETFQDFAPACGDGFRGAPTSPGGAQAAALDSIEPKLVPKKPRARGPT